MKRRELLVIFGAAAIAWPLGVQAQQQAKVWRVGFLAIPQRPASLEFQPIRCVCPRHAGTRLCRR